MKDHLHLLQLFLKHLEAYRSGLGTQAPQELYAPEDYILSLGGKRLRPLLALIGCELFGQDPALALDSALCVELFHNFSLVHDDILDAAPLRRNQPTVHVKWNANIAILSGDVMLVKAFQALERYDDQQFKQLASLFNATAIKVCEGQQWDMNFESSTAVTVSDYLHMITGKTAVLLGCSLQMGAINAGANEADQKHIYEFGVHLGLAFQLLDDLLDAFATDPEKFGKEVGGDIRSNKKTFLLLKALELANDAQREQITELMQLQDADKKVSSMLDLFKALDVKTHCEQEADKHTQLAIGFLDRINADAAKKQSLKQFALELLERQV